MSASLAFRLTENEYAGFIAVVVVSCFFSMFGYNKDLFLDPRK